jgi:hypothetical protein
MHVSDEFSPRFQVWQWRVQRVAWVVMAGVLVAALLGFFGGGPFADASKKVESGDVELELTYNRFNRQRNPQSFELSVQGPNLSGEELQVTVAEKFVRDIRIDSVTPDPDSTSLSQDGPVYSWQLDEGEEFQFSIEYRAEDWRQLEGEVIVQVGETEERLTFTQFLFP